MYIPDLTERFPEGFGGVDLTDNYFPSYGYYGYRQFEGYEPTYEELLADGEIEGE